LNWSLLLMAFSNSSQVYSFLVQSFFCFLAFLHALIFKLPETTLTSEVFYLRRKYDFLLSCLFYLDILNVLPHAINTTFLLCDQLTKFYWLKIHLFIILLFPWVRNVSISYLDLPLRVS
jgi:hypothetical protein